MRSDQFRQGRRNGVKGCVEWLHAEAARMNDPHARAVLNSAALHMGTELKQRDSAARTIVVNATYA